MRILLTGASGFIGTECVSQLLEEASHDILNIDIRPPLNPTQTPFWKKGDIMDLASLKASFRDFSPDIVIHLAARTECDENTSVEEGYQVNTKGTQHVLDAINALDSLKHLIMVSSQFVCGPGNLPKDDEDFFPHTIYGKSKVITEEMTRKAGLNCPWTIVRPVNIWGPYHERYAREFWKIAAKKLYFHPGVPSPTRTYGYVGNVVWQMLQILKSDLHLVDKQVFYVGDRPIVIARWTEGFFKGFHGKKPPTIPFWLIQLLAKAGDGISWLTRKPFYINSSRLKSMTQDYIAPMEKTFETFGEPPFSLEQGIEKSIIWYQESSNLT